MAKNANGDGMAYEGDSIGVSLYRMFLRDQIVFRVTVDTNDSKLPVRVHSVSSTNMVELVESARMSLFSYKNGPGEADVEVKEHVDSGHLQALVYSELPWLLAKLYVP